MPNSILLILLSLFFIGCDSSPISTSTNESTSGDLTTKEKTAKEPLPMLAILISYNDIKITSSATTWSEKLFGKNESQLNHYYLQASQNQFEFIQAQENDEIVNDGIVSLQLNKNHPNANIDDFSFPDRVYPDLKEALEMIDSKIDFSNYDNNADGHISPDELLLTFIFAGYEDAYEGSHVRYGIWAHQSCVSNRLYIPTLDAVTLMSCVEGGNFALFGERHEIQNSHDATIGIIAHELGHSAFDLPDLYNTIETDLGGIGYFGLMGAGTWGTKNSTEHFGNTPTHFSAWSKVFNVWVTPVIESTTSTQLLETASLDYNIIKIPIDSTSYYLLENRNNSGYDRGLYSLNGNFQGGMAIWKIDETKLTSYYLDNNIVNGDTNNKAVDLVEAVNGLIDLDADAGDESALFYEGNVNSFVDLITNISQRGSSMSLNIK